jgi:hypothetical protein
VGNVISQSLDNDEWEEEREREMSEATLDILSSFVCQFPAFSSSISLFSYFHLLLSSLSSTHPIHIRDMIHL